MLRAHQRDFVVKIETCILLVTMSITNHFLSKQLVRATHTVLKHENQKYLLYQKSPHTSDFVTTA
jgi:hypothetical protein